LETENKQQKIVEMFNDIAPTYDKANRVLSMGVDIQWRKKACDETFFRYKKDIDLIVDVACGTGDMMGYWKKQSDKIGRKIVKLLGVDPSTGMVAVGKEKFPEFEFIVKREEAFREFARVIKTGGYVVILEFTKDDKKGFFHCIKDLYMNKILPKIGGFISKNKEAYEYLPNSIEGFLTAEVLEAELDIAGFTTEFVKSFSMDISTLVIAKKR